MLPRVIGVVTSERGAVIQDIRTTILRRFPRNLLVWPVAVQGEGAAQQIAAAIAGFDASARDGPVPRPDVLIVARGGGSLEDLMAFNEEIVLRAVAACRIPLISAVGHETDTTLIDFVSDRRAPTPTAAAEMAIPARADLLADLAQKAARLAGALAHVTRERRLRLLRAERLLPDLPSLLGHSAATAGRSRRPAGAGAAAICWSGGARRWRRSAAGCRICRRCCLSARERVRDRGGRLVLALPNLVTIAASRAWSGRATIAVGAAAGGRARCISARAACLAG